MAELNKVQKTTLRRLRIAAWRALHEALVHRMPVHPAWEREPDAFAAYLLTVPGWSSAFRRIGLKDPSRGYVPDNVAFVVPRQRARSRTDMVQYAASDGATAEELCAMFDLWPEELMEVLDEQQAGR